MVEDTRVYNGHLRGVACEVESCSYHSAGNNCSASKITVESENAHQKVETFCSTFTPKASM